MKQTLLIAVALALAGNQSLLSQGSLTPPGSPGPTMKTLAQIEPRTAITNLPYTISQPGSYYLTSTLTNVLGGGVDGVTIAANDVTIDLNGFALVGRGSDNGVSVAGAQRNLSVHNGIIRSWGFRGVNALSLNSGLFERLHLADNGGDGLGIGRGCAARDCTASGNGGAGIEVGEGSLVRDCAVLANLYDGIVGDKGVSVIGCVARGNGRYGIDVNNGSTVSGCTVTSNSADGIQISLSCRVVENLCQGNGVGAGDGAGILVTSSYNRIEGNQVSENDRGLDVRAGGNLIIRNNASDNPTGSGTSNYVFSAGNNFGPTNNLIGAGGVITNQNPWANFSY